MPSNRPLLCVAMIVPPPSTYRRRFSHAPAAGVDNVGQDNEFVIGELSGVPAAGGELVVAQQIHGGLRLGQFAEDAVDLGEKCRRLRPCRTSRDWHPSRPRRPPAPRRTAPGTAPPPRCGENLRHERGVALNAGNAAGSNNAVGFQGALRAGAGRACSNCSSATAVRSRACTSPPPARSRASSVSRTAASCRVATPACVSVPTRSRMPGK